MTPITSFHHHLFISYAHIDNRYFPGGSKGWVDLLHERLEIRLAQLLGKPPKIWRDRKLKGFEVFDETIVIELSQAAILVSVVSPRYIDSTSCCSEIENFFHLASKRGGVQFGDKRRVFRVVKTYVPYEEHPAGLRDLLPYEFYERNEASGRIYEFDPEISTQGDKDKRYWNKFEDLAWDLHELIKYLEEPVPREQVSSGATIYLAETTSDLSEEHDKVKRELQQFGHQVLPDRALPLKAYPLQEAVRDYLKRSRLSVHLIGENYGIIPEMETERSIVRLQEELALERGDNAEFSRLIWMPPGLQPKDERQQKFVAELQNSFTSHNGSELLQVKLEDLKTIIQAKLTQKPKAAPIEHSEAGPTRIYLICDSQDIDAVEPLRNYLLDQKCEAALPLLEGSQAEVFEDHKENLLLCDAVLIFQGRASEGWLRMKLRELIKLPGYGRTTALCGKLIYLGAPESQSKDRFRTLEAQVIRHYGEFDPASLGPFIAQIKKAKGESI
jgi:hypothetical protein